jgi:NIPSNAP
VGLTPVLFARTLIGPRQPAFAYILTFPDLAARDAAWKRFREDPEWLKLRATPGYSDAEIMANISDFILTPTAYSQI